MLTDTYGMLKLINSSARTNRVWTKIADITPAMSGQNVLIRARIHTLRGTGKIAFAVLRDRIHAAQAVIAADDELGVSRDMVKWVTKGLTCESIVDIEACVRTVDTPITNDTVTQRTLSFLSLRFSASPVHLNVSP